MAFPDPSRTNSLSRVYAEAYPEASPEEEASYRSAGKNKVGTWGLGTKATKEFSELMRPAAEEEADFFEPGFWKKGDYAALEVICDNWAKQCRADGLEIFWEDDKCMIDKHGMAMLCYQPSARGRVEMAVCFFGRSALDGRIPEQLQKAGEGLAQMYDTYFGGPKA